MFVHPFCGKGHGVKTWEMVESMFSRANVQTKVRKCSYKLYEMGFSFISTILHHISLCDMCR